ncbi:uncharacterized protein LOC108225508 isoform X3 [Daucus carota subsp. sativus]|uniref:uncharacterized protein LOC108225508 isoform X3 n=1 Tax=Daucus carota subsp. sativus TaxID=79200 RepID=UPI003083A1C1
MSIICGLPLLECVYCLACASWAWKRCLHTAGHDSETWGLASAQEFEPVPRLCRGLNLAKEGDYAVLLDNKLGKRQFDGGYVHNGLLKAAGLVLDAECDTLKVLMEKYSNYTLTFTGHSLGSGVAALLAMVVVQDLERLGNISRKRVRSYAIAPARCMSLNLAVRYADVINSVVLQDDFLPRTATPLEDIFTSIFCLPCILCLRCMKDTCISEERMIRDPRRLYAPGRLYHIVERKPFRCGRFLPVVRTAVPVDGRFEHIVLSCNATSDHALIWIEREAKRALEILLEQDPITEIPAKQKMERQKTLDKEHSKEHKAALRRAVTLAVPHAFSPSRYGTFEDQEIGENSNMSSGDSSSEMS